MRENINHENHRIPTENHENYKKKNIEFNTRIMNKNQNRCLSCENHEKLCNIKIPLDNHENHENHSIRFENHENHEILAFH